MSDLDCINACLYIIEKAVSRALEKSAEIDSPVTFNVNGETMRVYHKQSLKKLIVDNYRLLIEMAVVKDSHAGLILACKDLVASTADLDQVVNPIMSDKIRLARKKVKQYLKSN